MRALERRADVLQMLRSSLAERSVFLWIGDENPQPTLRSASVVGANYGLGHRNLGAVGVVGPRRMDYATAIASVRRRRPRALPLLRDRLRRLAADGPHSSTPTPPHMPSDYYEVLGVSRDASDDRNQESLPRPRPRTAPRRHRPRPRGRSALQGGRRGLRGPLRRRAAPHLRPVRGRGRCAPAASTRAPASARSTTSSQSLFGQAFGGAAASAAAAARRPAATSSPDRADPRRGRDRGRARAQLPTAVVVCSHCHGNGAEPGTPIETCDRCGGAGQLRQVTRTPFGQMVRAVTCDVCHGSGKVPDTPCEVCDGFGRTQGKVTKTIDIPAGIEDGQRLRISGAGHAGEPGAPAGDLYVEVAVAADGRFERQGTDLVSAVRIPATEAMLGTTVTVATLEGEREIELEAGVQPGHEETLRGAGLPRLGGRRRGDQRIVVEVVVPTNLSEEQREIGRAPRRHARGPTTSGRSTATASSAASAKPSGRRSAVIRLAVRCSPDQADLVLAELTVLAPNGVEEERGPGYVEYAIYGGEGELPELGEIDAVVGGRPIEVSSTEIPDDWADRWRDFHKPLLVGERLWLRPSWEPRAGGRDRPRRRPRPGLRHRRPPDHPPLPRVPAGARRRGRERRRPDRPRHRLRRPRDRRREARLVPGHRLRPRARRRSRRQPPTPPSTASRSTFHRRTCANPSPSSPRPASPT